MGHGHVRHWRHVTRRFFVVSPGAFLRRQVGRCRQRSRPQGLNRAIKVNNASRRRPRDVNSGRHVVCPVMVLILRITTRSRVMPRHCPRNAVWRGIPTRDRARLGSLTRRIIAYRVTKGTIISPRRVYYHRVYLSASTCNVQCTCAYRPSYRVPVTVLSRPNRYTYSGRRVSKFISSNYRRTWPSRCK